VPSSTDLTIRPPATSEEVDAFFRLAGAEFMPSSGPDGIDGWRDSTLTAPGFDRSQIRCAYRDGLVVGGCLVFPRRLRAGPARLPVGCIGAVVTRPDHRGQGVASKLLADVLDRARAAGAALLLLDGIPDFYHRLGYVDVFDAIWHRVARRAALDLPPSPYSVRQGTKYDADQLLGLYERHYGGYVGSFDRSLDRQRHELPGSPERLSPLLAVASTGEVRGYLARTWEHSGARAGEVAADDWPAAVALLQAHAAALAGQPDLPEEVLWPLPISSPTFHLLADRLALRSEVVRRPRSDWQARVAHGESLLRHLLPLWRENWAAAAGEWCGRLEIRLGDEGALALDLRPSALEAADASGSPDARAVFAPAAFLRVLFGERDPAWAAAQDASDVSPGLLPTLARLLAAPPAWIPGTDAF